MIITVFKPTGQKTSISLDDEIISYLEVSNVDYKSIIKTEALQGKIVNSRDALRRVLRLIVKPSLVSRQTDIEDF